MQRRIVLVAGQRALAQRGHLRVGVVPRHRPEGGVAGVGLRPASTSRVTLDSILIPWQAGQTPEQIQADFPSVPLADVYGAIAYYLRNREEVDAWLREGDELYERQRAEQQAANPEFYARMRERLAEAAMRGDQWLRDVP